MVWWKCRLLLPEQGPISCTLGQLLTLGLWRVAHPQPGVDHGQQVNDLFPTGSTRKVTSKLILPKEPVWEENGTNHRKAVRGDREAGRRLNRITQRTPKFSKALKSLPNFKPELVQSMSQFAAIRERTILRMAQRSGVTSQEFKRAEEKQRKTLKWLRVHNR